MEKCKFPEGMEMRIGEHIVDPCIYEVEQRIANVTVEVLRCKCCGKLEVMWSRQENSVDLPPE